MKQRIKASKTARFLTHLLFPPVCRGCGERGDIFRTPDPLPLCAACLSHWAKAGEGKCEQCGRGIGNCDCMPPLLRQAGCQALVKAVGYHPDKKQLPERLILRCKRERDRELFRFFASDLQLKLWQALESAGGADTACVTYIPRRKIAAWESGVDQGRELARAIASSLELPMIPMLKNGARVEQKTLDFDMREANATASLHPRNKKILAKVADRTVILVDDITTAGATLSAATTLLRNAGAAQVICCVVAYTQS